MANYFCEMFGYVYYNDVLTYEALLRRENYLLDDFKAVLLEHNAAYINNIPLGDSLLVQCAFKEYDDDLFEKVCESLHTVLCEYVYCKLLFVDKELNFMHMCNLTHLGWVESSLHFPIASEIELPRKLPVVKGMDLSSDSDLETVELDDFNLEISATDSTDLDNSDSKDLSMLTGHASDFELSDSDSIRDNNEQDHEFENNDEYKK